MIKRKRELIIVIILFGIMCISVGYAILTRNLKINGNTVISANKWSIYFDNINVRADSIKSEVEPYITDTEKTNIDFAINLKMPGDRYEFTVDIVNDGTIDAMVDSYSLVGFPEEYGDLFEWNITYMYGDSFQRCDELLAQTRRKIKVVVNYKKDITEDELPTEIKSTVLKLTVNYVQLDESACTIIKAKDDPVTHTLTINPNYGKYNGTDKNTVLDLSEGEVYLLSTPVHPAHIFDGWTPSIAENYVASSKMVTMGAEDLEVVADWTWLQNKCFMVGDSFFDNFNTAMDTITGSGVIELVSNQCSIDYNVKVPYGKDITFDLNGHHINDTNFFDLDGSLKITDSSDSGSGELIFDGNNYTYFYNGGNTRNSSDEFSELTLENVKVSATGRSAYFILTYDGGDVTIDNCEIYTKNYVVHTLSSTSDYTTNVSITNSVINIEDGLNGSGELSAIAITGYGTYNAIFEDNKVNVIATSTVVWVIYAGVDKSNVTMNNVDIDVETRGSFNKNIAGLWTMKNVDSENLNMNVHGTSASDIQLIYSGTSGDSYLNLNSSSLKVDLESAHNIAMIYCSSGNIATLKDIDVDIKINSGAATIYPFYGSLINLSNSNVKIDAKNVGYIYGIYSSGGVLSNVDFDISGQTINSLNALYGRGLDYKDCNITINATDSGSIYGANGGGTLDNVNIKMNVFGTRPASITGMTFNAGTYKNSTLEIESNTSSQIYGLDNVKVIDNDTITIKANNENGRAYIYGVSGLSNITSLNLDIDDLGMNSVYGMMLSQNSTVTDSVVRVKSTGKAPLYGLFGNGVTSTNTEYYVSSDNFVNGAYKYGLYFTKLSEINGGKLEITGINDEQYSEVFYLGGVYSIADLTLNNFDINSSYSCVSFYGDKLTTNNVNMTCGYYGIKKGESSVVESTDTVINAKLS